MRMLRGGGRTRGFRACGTDLYILSASIIVILVDGGNIQTRRARLVASSSPTLRRGSILNFAPCNSPTPSSEAWLASSARRAVVIERGRIRTKRRPAVATAGPMVRETRDAMAKMAATSEEFEERGRVRLKIRAIEGGERQIDGRRDTEVGFLFLGVVDVEYSGPEPRPKNCTPEIGKSDTKPERVGPGYQPTDPADLGMHDKLYFMRNCNIYRHDSIYS